MAQVDWACSLHRIGENVFLNCLLYKALECISKLAGEVGDSENSRMIEPELTTVQVDKTAMGRLAAERLIALIEGEAPRKETIQTTVKLVVRKST